MVNEKSLVAYIVPERDSIKAIGNDDLIVSVKKRLVPPYPVCHPNQYKQSLKRVSALQPSRLYFAHLPPREGSSIDFADILSQAPTLPKNHWHSMKNRIIHALGWQTEQH